MSGFWTLPIELKQKLKTMDQLTLIEIFEHANGWRWHVAIEEWKPDGWENMEAYEYGGVIKATVKKLYNLATGRKTRYYYIHPICEYIEYLVPEKEIFRHHHTVRLGRTEEEFERWWDRYH